MAAPEEYGGLGLGVFDTALVLEEIAKVCYPTAMAVLGEVGVQTRILTHYAPEGFRRRILPRVVSGDAILAICMTEPDAGTDVANYRTAVEVRDRLIFNGAKTLISRADEAAAFVVFARIDGRPGREGIGCVLLERETPGFSVVARYHTMGGESGGNPVRGVRIAVGEPGDPAGRVSQVVECVQYPALFEPGDIARAGRGGV
jgi:alkylation response protein AidB-like acyl-CoA dehydrogenase